MGLDHELPWQFFKDIIAMIQITFYKTVGCLRVISGGLSVLGVCFDHIRTGGYSEIFEKIELRRY
jgi:hypothetical protein